MRANLRIWRPSRKPRKIRRSEDPKMQQPCARIFGFGAPAENLAKSEDPKIRRCRNHARESSDLGRTQKTSQNPKIRRSEDVATMRANLRICRASPNPKIAAHGCCIFGSSDLRISRGFLRTPQIRRFARMVATSSDLRIFGFCEVFCVRPKSEDLRAWLLHLRIFGSSDFAKFFALAGALLCKGHFCVRGNFA